MTKAELSEAVARAIADADGEDYMEDHRRYDKRADAAIAAYEAAKPAGEVVAWRVRYFDWQRDKVWSEWMLTQVFTKPTEHTEVQPLRAALAASPVPSEPPLVTAQRGFDTWAAKPHNKKWVHKLDGTPIPNDLIVCIAEAFRGMRP